ncbi:uncharacterized protein [Dermacentor andersoni]|uniref:uncharacterized protein n=1 Tax=Dermacentor andersoni TaxID=34620 RepID=UPI002416C971|nr:uncharacterized protein LOC129383640 [Dermacentor andersoni]
MAIKLRASTVLLIILLSMPSLSQVPEREYELLSEEGKQVTKDVRMMLSGPTRLFLYRAVNMPTYARRVKCWKTRFSRQITTFRSYRHDLTYIEVLSPIQVPSGTLERNSWNIRQADFIMRAKHGVPAILLIATYFNKTVDWSLSDYYYILGAQPSCYVMAALEPTRGKGRAICMYWIKEGTINETRTACDASYEPCRSIGGAVYNLSKETCDFGKD